MQLSCICLVQAVDLRWDYALLELDDVFVSGPELQMFAQFKCLCPELDRLPAASCGISAGVKSMSAPRQSPRTTLQVYE
jgi:hypothetical protein